MSDKRPCCLKCKRSASLMAERNLEGRVVSVRCLNCGEIVWRGFERRHPDKDERNTKSQVKGVHLRGAA